MCSYVSAGSLLYSCVSKICSKYEIYNLLKSQSGSWNVDKIVKFECLKKKKTTQSDMEFVKYFTPARFPILLNFTQKKRENRNIFGKKLRTEYVLLIYFQQFISFCAFIYSNTNSRQLFCENFYLNLANLAIFVNHRVNSGQFYPIPKTFYTSATCDKFHVWTQLSGGLGIDLSNQLKSKLFLLKLMIIRMYFP